MSDSSNPFIGNPFAQGVDKQKKTPPPQTQTIPKPTSARTQANSTQQATAAGSPPRTTGRNSAHLPKTGSQSTASTRSTAPSKGGSTHSNQTASPRSSRNTVVPPAISTTASTATNRSRARNRQTNEAVTPTSSQTPAKTSTKARKSSTRKAKSQTSPQTQSPVTSPPAPAYSGSGYKVQVLAKIPVSTNTNLPGRDYLWFAVYPIIPRVGDCIFNNGMYFRVDTVILYENTGLGWCADIEVSYFPKRR